MPQIAIPFLFMRGGSSRGPYFQRKDLPQDRESLSAVLLAAIGSGQPLNIDGIGGGSAVTAKVAILSSSADPQCDIDYLFAQVGVMERSVDYAPTCGNILSGVGPAALEMGLIAAQGPETLVRIHCVNTGARVEARVQTPDGRPEYEGDASIDGVPGTAAPIALNFHDVVGSVTGSLLPTGQPREVIDGIEVTCIDVAMPLVIARAEAFGLSGHETRETLNANAGLFERLEPIRCEGGRRMGMGDVSRSVTPKFALLSRPTHGGFEAARYFTPRECHPTLAVTGAQCLAACLLTPGSVAEGLHDRPVESPAHVVIEHPGGSIDVLVDFEPGPVIRGAGLLRTARLLARGEVYVPASVWPC